MSEKFVKIQSLQTGSFTSANNRVDFVIPQSFGKVSLRDSFIALNCAVSYTPDTANGVASTMLRWVNDAGAAQTNHFPNVAFVRNASISSANRGVLESVRRVDVLRSNIYKMRKSITGIRSDNYLSANSLKDLQNETQYGIFQDINKSGTVASRNNLNTPIQISLADCLDFCDADAVDASRLGDLRLSFELNVKNIGIVETTNALLTGSTSVNDDTAGLPKNITSLVLTGNYAEKGLCPYYVGQSVRATANVNATGGGGGGAGVTSDFTISQISISDAGVVTISSATTIYALTAGHGGMTGCKLSQRPATSLAFDLNLAELVVKQLPDEVEVPSTMLYHQFDTFELNGNSNTSYTDVIEINGGASNALVMIKNRDTGLEARADNVTSAQFALNNVPLTDNRPIEPYAPLYYDRLSSALSVADYVSKDLAQPNLFTDQATGFSAQAKGLILASPLFRTTMRKNLQIEIQAPSDGGVQAYILYTAVPKVLEM